MKYWKVCQDGKRCYQRAIEQPSCRWLILISNVLILIWIYITGAASVGSYTEAQFGKLPLNVDNVKLSFVDPGRLLLLVPGVGLEAKPDTGAGPYALQMIGGKAVADHPFNDFINLNQIAGLVWLRLFLPFSLFFIGKLCFYQDSKDVLSIPFTSEFSFPGQLIGVLLVTLTLSIPVLLLFLLIDVYGLQYTLDQFDFFSHAMLYISTIAIVTTIIFYYSRNLKDAYFKLNGSWLLFAILLPLGGISLDGTITYPREIVQQFPAKEISATMHSMGGPILTDKQNLVESSHMMLTFENVARENKTELFSDDNSDMSAQQFFLDQGMMKNLLIWILGVMVGSRRTQWVI